LVKAEKSREDGKSGKGVASDGKDEKDDGSEKGKSGKDRSSDSKDGKDGEDKSLGDEDDEIDDAVDKALGGNSLMDDHDKNDKMMKNSPVSKAKLDRAMQELQKEIQQEMRRAGQGAFPDSLLISLCRAYFRPKPEPWYVGITLLLKNKIREGRQIRERVPPIEMLTQVMTGNSVVQFEKTGRRLNIAFAVDVSGSMNDEEVVSGVLKIMNFIERNIPKGSHGHKFIFCQVDAGVEEWKEMDIPSRDYSAWKREIAEHGFVRRGRGGTEFAPFFKKIAEMKQKPDAVVVFSDMELYDYPQVEKEIGKLKNSVHLALYERTGARRVLQIRHRPGVRDFFPVRKAGNIPLKMKDIRLKELTEKLRSGQDVSPEEVDEIFEAAKESAQNGLSRKEIPELFYYDIVFLKDCDTAREVVSLGEKDIIEIAKR